MKKVLILFLFITISVKTYSQKYRFETSGVSMSIVDKKGKWTKYTDFKEAKIVITLDTQKDRITIYSEMLQFFKIVNYKEPITQKGDEVASFECVNQEGETCLISIYTYKKKEVKNRMYINYRDRIFAYNMSFVENKTNKK